ncbi:MAG: hypothetical protein GY835_04415 [bacterium]|nr:hypothetical protein [bacterium]
MMLKQFCLETAARIGILIYGLLFRRKAQTYRFDIWLRSWVRRRLQLDGKLPPVAPGTCRDVMFCFADHFEPGTKNATPDVSQERFNAWRDLYPPLARSFKDADGRHPQHSFFFPPHYYSHEFLMELAEMDWQEVGEVELHLHHENDDSTSLRALLDTTLELFESYGVFRVQGGTVGRQFGFIHGNWALDNSRPEYCGVNDELTILQECGCYADFTFPSLHESQPQMVNCLYRALDDPHVAKSYDIGSLMTAQTADRRGLNPNTGLPILMGPIGLRRKSGFPWFSVEDADVTGEGPGTPERVRNWVNEGIHVAGRPEWLFVKVHTHGAPERHRDALLGDGAKAMYETLCKEFNDGGNFRLHFVSAREMFNIARAAEEGLSGNAGDYRDYEIKPYLTRSLLVNGQYHASGFLPALDDARAPRADITLDAPQAGSSIRFKVGLLRQIKGPLSRLVSLPDRLRLEGLGGELEIAVRSGTELTHCDGERLVPASEGMMDPVSGLVDRYRVRTAVGRPLDLFIKPGGSP